jgi:hypothetical protein
LSLQNLPFNFHFKKRVMKLINTKQAGLFLSAIVLGFSMPFNMVNAQPDVPNPGTGCDITIQSVVSFQPAKRKDGSIIPAELTNTQNVLGVPQNSDVAGSVNYVSLGFGGEITVMLSNRLANGTGADFRIVETTFSTSPCSRYPEKVDVFVSQDGCNFVFIGQTCQDGSFDINGSGFDWIRYVKLHDVSVITHPFQNDLLANGFDLDGIQCINGAASSSAPLNTTFVAGSARTYQNFIPANPASIATNRLNPMNATGVPQNNNGTPVTFTSLGFGGEITLVFDYAVFDKAGPDLFVTETSGSNNYPEKAEFYGSANGINWVLLNTTEDGVTLEQDGWIDLNGALYSLKYLRIIDRSRRTQFTTGADGYDVDGVTVINGSNCTSTGISSSSARFYQTENNVADESGVASVYPNPFTHAFAFDFTAGTFDEKVNIQVLSITGQSVYSNQFEVGGQQTISKSIDFSHLPAGIYIMEISSSNGKESMKLIKN